MKPIYYFYLIFLIFSCSNTEIPESIDEKFEQSSIQIDNLISEDIKENEWTYIDSVRMDVFTAESNCDENIPTNTISNEKWTYCKINKNLELVYIESRSYNMFQKEEFILRDGMLIYAIEIEQTITNSDTNTWRCEYILSNNNIIEYSPRGVGESDMNNWQPESINTQWKSHEDNFKLIK